MAIVFDDPRSFTIKYCQSCKFCKQNIQQVFHVWPLHFFGPIPNPGKKNNILVCWYHRILKKVGVVGWLLYGSRLRKPWFFPLMHVPGTGHTIQVFAPDVSPSVHQLGNQPQIPGTSSKCLGSPHLGRFDTSPTRRILQFANHDLQESDK